LTPPRRHFPDDRFDGPFWRCNHWLADRYVVDYMRFKKQHSRSLSR
jgi:hypothetical protein